MFGEGQGQDNETVSIHCSLPNLSAETDDIDQKTSRKLDLGIPLDERLQDENAATKHYCGDESLQIAKIFSLLVDSTMEYSAFKRKAHINIIVNRFGDARNHDL